ncbi:MAG TPA: thiopeptide-type bacteriocin biosynthesis protein, partial [Alphaproteobacteria bacterium]|nr:thiopeptide-type bacteriocin biosynthesis protein [Alphaproteobacteria bacterium]
YAIAKHMAQSCEQAYVVDESYRKQIAARFREERRTLAALCGPTAAGTLPESALSAFRRFSAGVEGIRHELGECRKKAELTGTQRDLALNFVHMHLNRLLRSSHHTQETVLYNLLARTYAAKRAV